MFKKKSTIVFVLLLVLVAGLTWTNVRKTTRTEKEKQLVYQLKQLRMGVEIFKKMNGQNPADLQAALDYKFKSDSTVQWSVTKDEQGRLVDPFENPYQYDATTGVVKSSLPTYEKW